MKDTMTNLNSTLSYYFRFIGLTLLLSVICVTFSVTQSNSQEVSTTFVAFERLVNKWGGGRIYIGCGDDKFFKFKVEKNITGKFSSSPNFISFFLILHLCYYLKSTLTRPICLGCRTV